MSIDQFRAALAFHMSITDRAKNAASDDPMNSIVRTTTRNAKNWKDGEMKKRWIATGMLEVHRPFRRVKGYKDMDDLVAALRRHARLTPSNYDQAAA